MGTVRLSGMNGCSGVLTKVGVFVGSQLEYYCSGEVVKYGIRA